MNLRPLLMHLVFFVSAISRPAALFSQAADKPNFIFIVVDDLNDYVEQLTDQPQITTPEIKALAESGTLFTNAYANNPGCAPSRTSFMSGKDIDYTQVYNNNDYQSKFRDNFTPEKNNEEVFSFPQMLKDSGGYFTFCINKVFHNPTENDFDKTITTPMCDKTLSWNRLSYGSDSDSLLARFSEFSFGDHFDWGMIPDSLEYLMEDVLAADTAINFIHAFADSSVYTCGKPFFLGLGISRPHSERYIPAKYFPDYFMESVYDEPFVYPYNDPIGAFPYNGVVMPAQPDTIYQDYYNLPEGGIGRSFADNGKVYEDITDFVDGLSPLPEIDPGLTDEQRKAVLFESVNADYNINYIAAVDFADAQIGRVLDALDAHPELKENTIIILVGDNGYSFGEKRHWTKWSLWEPDLRVPFIIVDPSKPGNQQSAVPVTLLDLFPTICDMAGVAYPTFADGSKYVDGKSLIPLLENPEAIFEFPAVSTYKQNMSVGSCYPSYSVRNDRFHYLRYRKNNDGTFETTFCDSGYVGFEEELYEVGVHRETDPHEWNNLIENDDYKPVINYLEQWVTDSILYLQKTYKAFIKNDELSCFASNDDTLHLFFDLYDTTGVMVSPPGEYVYKWSNNLTADVFYGTSADFDLQLIPAAAFTANARLMVYLEMIGTDGKTIAGFDLKYFYLNDANAPEVTFTVTNTEAQDVCILDYSITGSYTDTWWDFGDGHTSEEFLPGTYTYASNGVYTITNFVEYGNDSCVAAFTKNITVENVSYDQKMEVSYYPNPASNTLRINFPAQLEFATLDVYDITGKKISSLDYYTSCCEFSCALDVSAYTSGVYLFVLRSGNKRYPATFVVAHH